MKFREDLIQIKVFISSDHTVHGSLFPQDLGEGAGINSCDARDILLL